MKTIWKLIKGFFKILGVICLLILLAYGGFHLVEYAGGGKYVAYLEANSQTIKNEADFSFDGMSKDFENNKLILVGEIHGFHIPNQFDVELFTHLVKNYGVRHYVAEFDFVQAQYLNEYMQSGNEALLNKALKNWAVVQGRDNKGYFSKFQKLKSLNDNQPEGEEFHFIGIDKLQDFQLTAEYLFRYDSTKTIQIENEEEALSFIKTLKQRFENSSDTLFVLNQIEQNLIAKTDKTNREKVLFENFDKIYKHKSLTEEKLYGYFGLFHVMQYRINGSHPLASQIRISDLGLEGKILSINFIMNESKMVMPTAQIPEFMRQEGPYSRMDITADNMLFMYLYGIKDLKRMTPEHHKSLINLDTEDSPYGETSRLNYSFQIFPVTDLFEFTDKGMPYSQYAVFVRNSDWAEPF